MPIDPETIRATRSKHNPDEFHNEIPNTDLTEGFWKTLGKDTRDMIRKSPLYDVKTNDQVKAEQPDATDAEMDEDSEAAAAEPVVAEPAAEPEPAPE